MAVVAFLRSSCQTQLTSVVTLLLTIDSMSDVSRVTHGLAIRRAKKRVNLTTLQRFDSHAYTRLQFVQLAMPSAQRRC